MHLADFIIAVSQLAVNVIPPHKILVLIEKKKEFGHAFDRTINEILFFFQLLLISFARRYITRAGL